MITLPVIAPALVSGWLLAFTLSLDDLVIASFVSGPGATTLPMVVFSSVRMGVSPEINALATLIIAAVSVIAFIAWLWMRRAEKRRLGLGEWQAGVGLGLLSVWLWGGVMLGFLSVKLWGGLGVGCVFLLEK